MRSALLSVKGVTRAQVRLEHYEAVVTYDPDVAKVEEMLDAVAEATHPIGGPGVYKATVKEKEAPAASSRSSSVPTAHCRQWHW